MSKKIVIVGIVVLLGVAGVFFFISQNNKAQSPVLPLEITPTSIEILPPAPGESSSLTQYLAIQIFTGSLDSKSLQQSIPPLIKDIAATVSDIVSAIGITGDKTRKLGFFVGPMAFDHTDDQIRQLMRDSFAIALQKNIAVGFHIDDSIFWGRLSDLNKIENIEWLDWNKTANTGRRLDWSSNPSKIMPQLCINSPAVKAEVSKRATLIGEEVKRGLATLKTAGKPELFAGVIAGWETQIGRDFDTGKYLGYCALTNKGYSAKNLPKDMDEARVDIVKEFVDYWTKSLVASGVPAGKIFSHTAFMPKSIFELAKKSQPTQFTATYLQTANFSPVRVPFGANHYAGFSTYPQFWLTEEIQVERVKNGNPPWASSEGTAIDPSVAEKGGAGVSMEAYLGDFFNHGAVLVNLFGWGVGDSNNPFRKVAESASAIQAYQKFLRGEILNENAKAQIPSSQFFIKMQKIQEELPSFLSKNGGDKVGPLQEAVSKQLGSKLYIDAEKTIDEILFLIEKFEE